MTGGPTGVVSAMKAAETDFVVRAFLVLNAKMSPEKYFLGDGGVGAQNWREREREAVSSSSPSSFRCLCVKRRFIHCFQKEFFVENAVSLPCHVSHKRTIILNLLRVSFFNISATILHPETAQEKRTLQLCLEQG